MPSVTAVNIQFIQSPEKSKIIQINQDSLKP